MTNDRTSIVAGAMGFARAQPIGLFHDASGRLSISQYRATMMIATTMNAATSERTRSSVFDPGFAAMSGRGMVYVGGCGSAANQATAPDFIGSNAMTIFSA